MKQLLCCSDTG